jgi:hypothetical protein
LATVGESPHLDGFSPGKVYTSARRTSLHLSLPFARNSGVDENDDLFSGGN